jgi:hypothetical protein
MLPPDERATARDALVNALTPTRGMLDGIQADPVLSSGFEDPEVMSAVAEIAANPTAISKYKGNAKVLKFYAAMGQLVGGRLDELGVGSDTGAGSRGGDGAGSAGGAGRRPCPAAATAPQVRWRESD